MASPITDPAKDARCYAAWVAGTESLLAVARREGYQHRGSVVAAGKRHAKRNKLPILARFTRTYNRKLPPEADREALELWRAGRKRERQAWAKKWGVAGSHFYYAFRRAERAEEPRDPKTGPTLPKLRRCCGGVFNARNPCPRCGDQIPA